MPCHFSPRLRPWILPILLKSAIGWEMPYSNGFKNYLEENSRG
jgi:hypothetical protein